jgi:hypothetical protein
VDTYRGRSSVQAAASGTSPGPGDLILRTKYNLVRQGASGLALGAEATLSTGDEQNLLGSGNTTITPRAIVSYEESRAAVHGTAGYTFGGFPTKSTWPAPARSSPRLGLRFSASSSAATCPLRGTREWKFVLRRSTDGWVIGRVDMR